MGKKSSTPSYVLTRRIYLEQWQYDRQEKTMNACNKLYNTAAKHCRAVIQELQKDVYYRYCLKKFRAAEEKAESDLWADEIGVCMAAYELTEYSIHSYIGKGRARAYKGCIGINIAQKLGTALYKSVRKAVFAGTRVHFRKKGQTVSYEDKKASSGIIYHPEKDSVYIQGVNYCLKPVRDTDLYMQEASKDPVKYCRVKRKTFKGRNKYFLQYILKGTPPDKSEIYLCAKHRHTLGQGPGGVDEGISTCGYYTGTDVDFSVLADGVEKYEEAVRKAAVKYERRLRMANPECYNEDGTLRRGARIKKRTKGSYKALMELKNAYRLKSVHVNQCHDILANQIVSCCNTIIKEPMNYRALARRSGAPAERQKKEPVVKKKDGTVRKIHKFKRKKRFGTSIGRRSPGLLNLKLEKKVTARGGTFMDVSLKDYKASQYDHTTQKPTRALLSDRSKIVGGHRVQRDFYSSFLLYAAKDRNHIDFELCIREFKEFLRKQEKAIARITATGDKTGNFGLKDFMQET